VINENYEVDSDAGKLHISMALQDSKTLHVQKKSGCPYYMYVHAENEPHSCNHCFKTLYTPCEPGGYTKSIRIYCRAH